MTIEWGADGESARLAVLDEGPGIDPDERERVFERFFRGEAAAAARGHRPRAAGRGGAGAALGRRGRGSSRPEGGTRAEVRLPLGRHERTES